MRASGGFAYWNAQHWTQEGGVRVLRRRATKCTKCAKAPALRNQSLTAGVVLKIGTRVPKIQA